jgi:hypothetical protein
MKDDHVHWLTMVIVAVWVLWASFLGARSDKQQDERIDALETRVAE